MTADLSVLPNHSERVFSGVPASLAMLAKIAQVTAGKIKVFFDNGIINGHDFDKALLLDANTLLQWRRYIWGLGALGAVGIAHVIKLTRGELEMTMNLSGTAELSDIRPKHTA